MISNFKTEQIKDRNHLIFVASLNCVVTGSDMGVQAHHLMRDDLGRIQRGTGLKAGDDRVIPLNHLIHSQLHRNGNEGGYLLSQGIFWPVELALILYDHTGDEMFCNRVLEAWGR